MSTVRKTFSQVPPRAARRSNRRALGNVIQSMSGMAGANVPEDAMSKAALLCSAGLIVFLADGAAQPQTQGTAIPNLSSANFGWQHGLGFRLQPIEGRIAPPKAGPPVPGVERLADDKNPNLTPWAAAQIRMHNDLVKDGHQWRISNAPPKLFLTSNSFENDFAKLWGAG